MPDRFRIFRMYLLSGLLMRYSFWGIAIFPSGGGYNENITSQLYRMLENTQK